MPVSGNLEFKLEQAVMAVLATNAELAGITIRRFHDTTANTVEYPIIVVHCSGAGDEEWSVLADFSEAFVGVMCMTYAVVDTTSATVNDMLGAVRDTIYRPTFTDDLTGAVSGLTIYGAQIDGPSGNDDNNEVRVRTLTLKIHASAADIADETSSSSSSP